MALPGDHLLWRATGDVVYTLNIRDGRYAGLSGVDAKRWVGRFGSARTSRPQPPAVAAAPGWRWARHWLSWRAQRRVRSLLAQQRFHDLYALAESVAPQAPTRLALSAVLRPFFRTELLFSNRHPERDCLPRSFALYLYLKWLGFRVEHRIGITTSPFDAHAWVELDGKAILERGAPMTRWHLISVVGRQREEADALA